MGTDLTFTEYGWFFQYGFTQEAPDTYYPCDGSSLEHEVVDWALQDIQRHGRYWIYTEDDHNLHICRVGA